MTRRIKVPCRSIIFVRFFDFIVIIASSVIIVLFVSPATTSAATLRHHTEVRKIGYQAAPSTRHSSHHSPYVSVISYRAHNKIPPVTHRKLVVALPKSGDQAAIPPAIVHVITEAQRKCKLDPGLLLAIAFKESSFNPKALNRHSTARGLLQFTDATWLTVIRDFGHQYGLGRFSAAIETDQDGRLRVKKPRLRRAILTLRDDPVLQAVMMAERLEQERAPLELRIGRPATPVDLYFLHMLGPTGAARFLTDLAQHPDNSSLDVVDAVADVNTGLFIKDGRPRSVAETYGLIQADFDKASFQYPGIEH